MIPVVLLVAALATDAPAAPQPREIASGVHLLPGGFPPGRGPDGNTVVFDAPDGLIVVDTGRHAWHRDGRWRTEHRRIYRLAGPAHIRLNVPSHRPLHL